MEGIPGNLRMHTQGQMKTELQTKLTEEQIQGLLADYLSSKDVRLRDKVVLQYRDLVQSVARRFSGSGEPLEDLTQEGYIGLITATDLYDKDKGVKFSTYATHFIIGQVKHSLRDRGKIIKEPAWLQELNHRMTRVIEALCQELGRQPTDAEIAKVMHLPEETVAGLLTTREIFKVGSLDYDQNETNGGGLDVEKVEDDKYTTFQLPAEDKIVLEMAVNKLKLVEQKVIQEFYFTGLSQTEIAKRLGISCNYVSHILRSGTRKLRRILTTEEVRDVQIQLQSASRRSDTLAVEAQAGVIDNVTGLYGKRYLEDRLAEELNRAAREKSEVAFAIISAPELEDFGATFGSMRRDDALYGLAQLVKKSVRRCDVGGRLGDWTFGLILLHTNRQASRVCERVRSAIRAAEFETGRPKSTVSFEPDIGYAVYPTDSRDPGELINLARAALAKAEDQRSRKKAA